VSPAGRRRPFVAGALALLVGLLGWSGVATASVAHPASSARDSTDTVTAFGNLTGTATFLDWDTDTLAAWKAAGVSVGPAGTALAVSAGAGLELPITSGYVESHSDLRFKPSDVLGSIDHFGSGLTFASSSTSVTVTDLVFDLGGSMVYATIGGTEDVPLFSLQERDRKVKRSGQTLEIQGAAMDLTPTGAAALDAIFHNSAITANTELAAVTIEAKGRVSRYSYTGQTVEYPRLSGIALSLTFATPALAAFHSDGITPSAVGSASYDSALGDVSFPITGGTAVVHPGQRGRPEGLAGVVLGWGNGLVLGEGSTSVAMTDLTFVPATSTVYASVNGGADDGALFAVKRPKRSRISLTGGNLELRGAYLDLTAGGAAMLNGVFHTTGFERGFELGKLTLVASG